MQDHIIELPTFKDYLYSAYPTKNSGTPHSYITAIKILDEIFQQRDVFNLNGVSLMTVKNPLLIAKIVDFIAEEEDRFRRKESSIFDLGKATQTSYPRGRFCTAAIKKLSEYITHLYGKEASSLIIHSHLPASKLSTKLMKKFDIDDEGTEKEVTLKRRIGQEIFRSMLLTIYNSKCCVTGIEVPDVLRASHIIPWSKSVKTRLNPENGLCLSATYDAAFDRYLITFDEHYRLVLSPVLKERYSSEAFKINFLNFEGKAITLPSIYKPSQEYLERHRENLAT